MGLYERDQKNPHIIGRLLVFLKSYGSIASMDRSMQIDFSTQFCRIVVMIDLIAWLASGGDTGAGSPTNLSGGTESSHFSL